MRGDKKTQTSDAKFDAKFQVGHGLSGEASKPWYAKSGSMLQPEEGAQLQVSSPGKFIAALCVHPAKVADAKSVLATLLPWLCCHGAGPQKLLCITGCLQQLFWPCESSGCVAHRQRTLRCCDFLSNASSVPELIHSC